MERLYTRDVSSKIAQALNPFSLVKRWLKSLDAYLACRKNRECRKRLARCMQP